jgi:flagellar hook-associated protein 1
MSLDLALSNAVSGLQAAQTNLALISSNIANAQTPGYSRQVLPATSQVEDGAGGGGVQTGVAERITDPILTANLQAQNSTTVAASTLDNYYQSIQNLFGSVSANTSLNSTLSTFSGALQTLAATPEDTVAQSNAISSGQALTQQLNGMSTGIQTLRANADTAIGTAVTTVNGLLTGIANFNTEIAHAQAFGQSTATLEDQRDQAVQQLSQQMNIQSFTNANDQVSVLTGGGKTLVSNTFAEQISFTPTSTFGAGVTGSGLSVSGTSITGDITGGNIGALLQMRDTQLPNLTSELNQFSTNLFNTVQVPSASQILTVGGGVPAAGDTFSATVDGTTFATTAALPANPSTTDIVNALNASLAGSNFSASTNGDNVEIADKTGKTVTAAITAVTGTETFTPGVLGTTNSGLSAAPGDANHFFAAVDATNAPGQDNAATIEINPSLVNDPSLLDGTAATPDPTIAQMLATNIASATPTFPAAGNFGSSQAISLSGYAAQILGQSATAAASASDNTSFQTGVQNEISARVQSVSGVNMDEELANLSVYQTAYTASARVLQTVNTLYDALLQIQS